MPGLTKTAVPAAVAGGSLLFSDDTEAGFLTKGVRGARDKVGYDPTARGNTTLKLGLSRAPDGSGLSTNDRLDVLVDAIDGMNDSEKAKYFAHYIHQKSNYDVWNKEAKKADGGQFSGDNYKSGLDAFLEDIIERRPALEPIARDYAMNGKRGRLSRTTEDVEASERWRRQNNPNRGRHRAVGGSTMGQDHLEATMHNREQKLNEHMDNLGMTKDSMYEYGSLLPIKQDITTGAKSLAVPDMIRDITRGLLGLGMTPETGVYDPQNLMDVAI